MAKIGLEKGSRVKGGFSANKQVLYTAVAGWSHLGDAEEWIHLGVARRKGPTQIARSAPSWLPDPASPDPNRPVKGC